MCCQGQVLGEFGREKFPGEFMDAWRSAVTGAHFDKVCLCLCVQVGAENIKEKFTAS